MASSRNKPCSTSTIARDRRTIQALKNMPDYAPRRPEHSVEALIARDLRVQGVAEEVATIELALGRARARLAVETWGMHDDVLGARDEVMVQYGPDSQAVEDIGLKRKSDRKRPVKRPAQIA